MDWFTGSEPAVRAAVIAGALAFSMTLAMMLYIFWLRNVGMWRAARRKRFIRRWRPLLISWVAQNERPLPPLARRDWITFLYLWNEAHESVRGAAKDQLNALAKRARLADIAMRLLHSRSLEHRLWAVLTLGNLQHREAWRELAELAAVRNAWLSFAAARALVRVHPVRAVHELMPLFAKRADWPRARVLAVLREAGPEAVSRPLADIIGRISEQVLPRCLAFLSAAQPEAVRVQVLNRLYHTSDPQVIAACLRHHRDPRDLPVIRKMCEHPDWIVRVQAARALSALSKGDDEDVVRLLKLLGDEAWWVRFRAAQGLLKMFATDRHRLRERLHQVSLSPAAEAMLDHVLTARGLAPTHG